MIAEAVSTEGVVETVVAVAEVVDQGSAAAAIIIGTVADLIMTILTEEAAHATLTMTGSEVDTVATTAISQKTAVVEVEAATGATEDGGVIIAALGGRGRTAEASLRIFPIPHLTLLAGRS